MFKFNDKVKVNSKFYKNPLGFVVDVYESDTNGIKYGVIIQVEDKINGVFYGKTLAIEPSKLTKIEKKKGNN